MNDEFLNWLKPMMDKTIINIQIKEPIYKDIPNVFKMELGELYKLYMEEFSKPIYYRVNE